MLTALGISKIVQKLITSDPHRLAYSGLIDVLVSKDSRI